LLAALMFSARLLSLLLAAAGVQAEGVAGKFDYYALALSWSPQHCAIKPMDREQCSRQLGWALHGLWPQYWRGYPSHCSNERLAPHIERQFPDLYPNRFLYRHQWQKHGTCSGLSQPAYHQLASKWRQKVAIPASHQAPASPLRSSVQQLKTALGKANPWLNPTHLTLGCADSGRFMREIYLCLNKEGTDSIPCPAHMQQRERRSCGQADFLLRGVR